MKSTYEIWRKAMEKKRAPAIKEALKLIAESRFAEADALVKNVDPSIEGQCAYAAMYRDYLKTLIVPDQPRQSPHAEAVFRRALEWAQGAYPDPHTQIEADDFSRGRDEDLAELVEVMGYEPPAE